MIETVEDWDQGFSEWAREQKPHKHSWHRWFAWYPVPTGEGYAWLTTIERRYHTSLMQEAWECRRINSDKSAAFLTWSWF